MFVGVLRVVLHLVGVGSLKGKRRIVKSTIERARAKFNAAVAEVGDNDSLGSAVIAVAVVGNSASHVDSMLGRIASFIEGHGLAPVASIATEVIPFGEDLGMHLGDGDGLPGWDDDEEEI
ncbi:MAG: DUF503 domain-containing protein [Deltaproteobacteria bacterium]|nr:DUF503 domain-containing protein [Deltaproteobacteria bacterium]